MEDKKKKRNSVPKKGNVKLLKQFLIKDNKDIDTLWERPLGRKR
tara:strand:- start:16 stop:147 length:132 start_codon:yes stop_codon:yes gene_type:complete